MSLRPDYRVVAGNHQITKGWSVELPVEFNRRVEDDDLVLWRPALTIRIAVWNSYKRMPVEDRVIRILEMASDLRTEQQIERRDGLVRLTYELPEADRSRPEPTVYSIYGAIITPDADIDICASYDTPATRTLGYRIIHSVNPTPHCG